MKRFVRRQRRAWAVLLGTVLILVGGVFILFFGRQHTLSCSRLEPTAIVCAQQVSWFKLIPLDTAQTSAPVQSAAIEEHCYTDNESGVYECLNNGVQLVTSQGAVSLSPDFFNTATA